MSRRPNPTLPQATEAQEQAIFVAWLRLRGAVFVCPMAEGRRSPRRAGQAKAMGLQAGVPDVLILSVRRPARGLAIELKRIGGPGARREQLEWGRVLDGLGWRWEVCHGVDAAIKTAMDWGV